MVHHQGTSVSDSGRQPDAFLVNKNLSRAISSILVPFAFTAERIPSKLNGANLIRKHQQLLRLVHAILKHQPMRRFCWTASFSKTFRDINLLHILAVTRSGSQVFTLNDPLNAGHAPTVGAFLNFISCSPVTSLGFLPDIFPHVSSGVPEAQYPVGDVRLELPIILSKHHQGSQAQPISVHGQLTHQISLGVEPGGRDTIVFPASILSAFDVQRQPVAKLAWLEDDHFASDGKSIEELVLTELAHTLSTDDPLPSHDPEDPALLTKAQLSERLPSLLACRVFRDGPHKAKSGRKTAVLYLMEGKGGKLTKDSFKTIGEFLAYLQDLWKSA